MAKQTKDVSSKEKQEDKKEQKGTVEEGKSVKKKEESSAKKTSGSEPASPKTNQGEPQTMEELLSMTGYVVKGIKKGDVVEGVVTKVTPKEITIDIGGKTEGVVIDRELETYKETLMSLVPGSNVTAQIIVSENDRGQAVLSLRRSIFEKRWIELTKHKESGEPVEVIGKEVVRGGMLVDYNGLRGYIPQSQFDTAIGKQLEKQTNKKMMVKVMEVDQASNRLIFSQRAVSDAENLVKQKALLTNISVGETVSATVTGIVPFGAFAKFTIKTDEGDVEVEGLIHISEIAWEKVEDPGQYLKVGDTMKVKLVGIDEKTGKLTLSLKQLLPDPWEHVIDMFEKDTQVKGTVSRVSPYGAFVNLSPGIDGLIHVSKLPPGEEPKVGDEVTVTIEDIQPDKRKISLSMALTEKPIGYR